MTSPEITNAAVEDATLAYAKTCGKCNRRGIRAALAAALPHLAAGRAEAVPIERDTLGRMVREAWVRWAHTQPSPKPSWLVPYDELAESDKEADRQIGEAIAKWTVIHYEASRAVRAEAVAAGWQTMDTAPKDGTPILLLRGPNRIVVGQWDKDNYRKNPRPFWTDDTEKIWGRNRLRDEPPKGWMPLPGSALVSAPAAEAEPAAWATGDAKAGGWTLDPKFIDKVSRAAREATGYDATWEVVEHVYLAALAAPSASQEALREALEPFAKAADVLPPDLVDATLLFSHFPSMFGGETEIRVGDLRKARAVMGDGK